jgi:single-strand DNA-binding protein
MADLKMPDINSVMIAGNLTTAPSFRKTTNGTPVANFYIASNRRFKDNTGQWRENVCYVGVVAWYKLAESCAENLHKGSAVLVDGELQSRIWKNEDGSTKNVVEIKARRIQFLNRRLPSGEMVADGEEMDNVALDDSHEPPPTLEETPAPASGKSNTANEFSFGYENLKL